MTRSRLATADPTTEPEDDPFAGHFDPLLGQSDRLSAGCLWALMAPLFVMILIPFGFFASMAYVRAVDSARFPAGLASQVAWLLVLACQIPIAVRTYFSRGATGRFGAETTRLKSRLPHHEGRVRGPITLLPGVRPTLPRRAILFPTRLRTVILSHGWRPGVQVFALAVMAVALYIEGAAGLIHLHFWMIPLMSFFTARRMVSQEIVHADLAEVTRDGAVVTVTVRGGPLYPGFTLTSKDENSAQAAEEALTREARDVPADTALERLDRRLSENA